MKLYPANEGEDCHAQVLESDFHNALHIIMSLLELHLELVFRYGIGWYFIGM